MDVRSRRVVATSMLVAVLGGTVSACGPRQPWRSELVSVNAAGDNSGNGASVQAAFSPDGTKVVFVSSADDLGPRDTNSQPDVYLRDLTSGTTTLVSVNAAGTDSADGASVQAAFSPDGRKIAFASTAGDLAPTDTNATTDVYVRDLSGGTTTLVSVNAVGTGSGNRSSSGGVFSPDGTRIAFESQASDLVTIDGNEFDDVFVRDLVTGTTTLVSVNAAGTGGGNAWSHDPRFSPDGTKVAFESAAEDLGPTDTNGEIRFLYDVYVRDLVAGTTALVSVNAAGTDSGGGTAESPVFSPDGTKIAFLSDAADLVATDTNRVLDVFVRDLVTGTTSLVSVSAAGTDSANRGVLELLPPVFSPDGSKVVFLTEADDLGPKDTNEGSPRADIYLRDLVAGTTSLVSVAPGGTDTAAVRAKAPVAFSPDGTKIAFGAEAQGVGLTPIETRTTEHVYVRDLADGRTTLVPTDATGATAENGNSRLTGAPSGAGVFSPDGKRLAYVTSASNLGPTDGDRSSGSTGANDDVYVATLRGADLTIDGVVEPDPVPSGSTVTWRFEVDNAGPDPAEDVTAIMAVPTGSRSLDIETTQGQCRQGYLIVVPVVDCELGDLPAGGGAEVTVRATTTAPAGTSLPVLAGVTSAPTADPFHRNNTVRLVATVADGAGGEP